LEKAFANPSVKAVVLSIDSPGGAPEKKHAAEPAVVRPRRSRRSRRVHSAPRYPGARRPLRRAHVRIAQDRPSPSMGSSFPCRHPRCHVQATRPATLGRRRL
jgi:hypothetical protein